MCKLVFNDGTVLEVKEYNGNCVVSTEALDFSAKNLKNLKILTDERTIEFTNAKLNGQSHIGNEYNYVFAEMTEKEIADAAIEAQIIYTAMMTDSLLEE